jgi:hypothetical protein
MMQKTIPVALNTMRAAGVGAVALGLSFWAGQLLSLLPIHMALGLLVVLSLWALSAAALVRGGFRGRAVVLLVLGLLVLGLGISQAGLLPGPQHWVIRTIHLLLGIAAFRQGEVLARSLRASSAQSGAQKPGADRLAAQNR